MKTTIICQVCKNKFSRVHTFYKPPKFCSRACANKAPGRMTEEIRKKVASHGPKHGNFKGGWVSNGYFYVWIPHEERKNHPTINARGYLKRSHYVWNNNYPKDKVEKYQIVHHINGQSMDDRIENLCKVQTQREHMAFHKDIFSKKKRDKKSGQYK